MQILRRLLDDLRGTLHEVAVGDDRFDWDDEDPSDGSRSST